MKTFSTLAVVAALSSSAIATNLLHEKAGRLDRRHGNAHIAPQWIKRRSPIQRRQATSIVPGEASLLTVSNTTDAATPSNATTTTSATAPVYTGTALWFYETGSESACYTVHTDEDFVVGLSTEFWPNTGKVSSYCGQYLSITGTDSGKTITALISDASGKNYTTLTRAAFAALGDLEVGMIPIAYTFINATSSNSTSNSTLSSNVTSSLPLPSSAVSTALPVSTTSHSTAVPTTTATPTATVDTAALAASADAESSRLAKLSSASVASVASVKSQQAADAAASEAAASSSSAAAAAASSKAAALKQQQEQAAADAAASSSSAAAAAASSKAAAAKKASEEAAYQATHTVQAAAVQTTAASSSSSQTYTGGYATFYTQNGVAGACGKVNPDSALIIAQDSRMYNNGANCGRSITLTRTDNGASVTAVIADECPTCETATSLDLSVGAFTKIATEEEGMVPISWHYND